MCEERRISKKRGGRLICESSNMIHISRRSHGKQFEDSHDRTGRSEVEQITRTFGLPKIRTLEQPRFSSNRQQSCSDQPGG